MTTLEAFGFNIAAGLGLATVALSSFGIAVMNQSDYVAPRCSARPRNVIYNPDVVGTKHDQNRGNPFLGWIPWTLGLSYDTLLNGVPGTGTRNGGKSGLLLKANLDSIVLLRFHALGLKISALATVLFMLVLLPMYYTAGCARYANSSQEWENACSTSTYNLTNYERTTIANVPASLEETPNLTQVNVKRYNAESAIRLYFAVATFWIVQGYLIYLLRREWIEILAMRRVYYLEADVWRERKQELGEVELFEKSFRRIQSHRVTVGGMTDGGDPKSQAAKTAFGISGSMMNEDDMRLERRDPWIPHPEHRDTVPNIQLYSVLVGGLPSMPEQENMDPDSPSFKRQTMDWQLELTATFFDHCVPNQPGFSSSVAAVTILPSSKAVATAWRKWYGAAKKLRRLRFIRAQIAKKYQEEMEALVTDTNNEDHPSPPRQTRPPSDKGSSMHKSTDSNYKDPEQFSGEEFHMAGLPMSSDSEANAFHDASEVLPVERVSEIDVADDEAIDLESPPLVAPQSSEENNTFLSAQEGKEYYENLLNSQGHDVVLPAAAQRAGDFGLDDASEITTTEKEIQQESLLMSTFGPEQIAIYSREFAQSAAPCCPNGCCESAVENSTLEELLEMEREAINEVTAANVELWEVQQHAKQLANSYNTGGVPSLPEAEGEDGDASSTSLREGDEPVPDLDLAEQMETGVPSSTDTASSLRERRKTRINASLVEFDDDAETESESRDSGRPLDPFGSHHTRQTKWEKVLSIVYHANKDIFGSKRRNRPAISGKWKWPTFRNVIGTTRETAKETTGFVTQQTMDFIDLSRESTYAIVTFTSRQAAVAARQCLADARSAERWVLTQELPIPPLADAAAWDLCAFRNCCRPVTLSIDDRQKSKRRYFVVLILAAFYIFSPAVLSLFSSLLQPQTLEDTFPKLFRWLKDSFGAGISGLVSGFLQSVLYTTFFTLCPVFFRTLSNFGSNAYSVANAELSALKYFWWFMVISAFSGVLIANMFLYGFSDGLSGGDVASVLLAIARSIPSSQAASWLNWIILRTTFIMTSQYLLQMPAFLFAFGGMQCCSRLSRGGGPGPPTPYRLYVDSGMVLLSLLALAPSSPLVAPAAFCYFLYSQPILRRCVIFVYRPKFDSGGLRWPFLFQLSIACLLVGQILLTLEMVLKQAPGPAAMAAIPILLTLFHYGDMKRRFTKPFLDAALLQTSLLDGWDSSKETTREKREDFRRFLVDAHKAAYVPVCLAGTDNQENSFTAEPAVVVPLETDLVKDLLAEEDMLLSLSPKDSNPLTNKTLDRKSEECENKESATSQYGAVVRRAVKTLAAVGRVKAQAAQRAASTRHLDTLAEESQTLEEGETSEKTDYFLE